MTITKGFGQMLLLTMLILSGCQSETPKETVPVDPPTASSPPDPVRVIPDYTEAFDKIEAFIDYQLKDKNIPGLSVSLVDGDSTVYAGGFGVTGKKTQSEVDEHTVYRVASLSKLFNALAIMTAVEKGTLDLDTPIGTYLPNLGLDNPFGKPVTLRHLVSHQSGIIREPPVGHYFDTSAPGIAATVASLKGSRLQHAPGTASKYSNAGATVAGYALEQATNVPFSDYLDQHVFGIIGMSSSSFEPRTDLTERLATGYMWTYDGQEFDAPVFELGMVPAANLYTTVSDLARFARMLIAGGSVDGKQVVESASLTEMFTPQFAEPNADAAFGLGFSLDRFDGMRRVQHGGVMYGYASRISIIPEAGIGFAAVATMDASNSVVDRIRDYAMSVMLSARAGADLPDFPTQDAVPYAVARRLDGRYSSREDIIDLSERNGALYIELGPSRYRTRYQNERLIVDDRLGYGTEIQSGDGALTIDGRVWTKQPSRIPPAAPAELVDYIGEYGWDHNVLYILEDRGQLFALIEWFFKYPLEQISGDTFRFPDSGLYIGEDLTFQRAASGRIASASVAGVKFERRATGSPGATFKIKPLRPIEELRAEALAAEPFSDPKATLPPDLVEVASLDPSLRLDMRYATTNNFMDAVFYEEARLYMQRPAAEGIVRAHQQLARYGLGLLLHDGLRPWYVTKMFWDATPRHQRGFVADPKSGSRHNRGCAIDLSLFDLATGEPIEMTGGYDEFTTRSYPDYPGGTARQRWHRELLRDVMESQGFRVFSREWWHFDHKDWRKYDIQNPKPAGYLPDSLSTSQDSLSNSTNP